MLSCEADETTTDNGDKYCIVPVNESCYVPVVVSTGIGLAQGRYAENPWKHGEMYCSIKCMSPSECETSDDCAIDPCVFSQCIEGKCLNTSYSDGSACVVVDPWTKQFRSGQCDGCYCRPPYED